MNQTDNGPEGNEEVCYLSNTVMSSDQICKWTLSLNDDDGDDCSHIAPSTAVATAELTRLLQNCCFTALVLELPWQRLPNYVEKPTFTYNFGRTPPK